MLCLYNYSWYKRYQYHPLNWPNWWCPECRHHWVNDQMMSSKCYQPNWYHKVTMAHANICKIIKYIIININKANVNLLYCWLRKFFWNKMWIIWTYGMIYVRVTSMERGLYGTFFSAYDSKWSIGLSFEFK